MPVTGEFSDARFDSTIVDPDYDADSLARFAEPDYYRDKIREYQVTLNQLASVAEEMKALAVLPIAPEFNADVYQWLDDYESKRWQFVTTAEAINAAAASANAVGFRMPVVSIPSGLNAAPLLIAGVAGAVAAAAALIAWATDQIMSARVIAGRMAMIEGLAPEDRARAIEAEQRIALAETQSTPLSQIANIAKWAAIAVAVFFGFKAWQEYSK